MKIYGIVVAGGTGTRMGNAEKPKQFLHIGDKPILVHTMEKFYINSRLDKVLVLCPEPWISYTKDLLEKYLPDSNQYVVLQGGRLRNDTIMNAIQYIEENYGLEEDTYVITHDAVRPFITQRVLEENMAFAQTGQPCDTVIPATDTLVESIDGETISQIPNRANYYQGQTPQSFRAKEFKELYNSLTEDEKESLTDATKVFVIKGKQVALVMGETFNIKVTYPYDLQLAETLLRGGK